MILVTGAGGKTGKAVIRALAQTGQPVRAWQRRPEQVEGTPETDSVVGDMEDAALWRRACRNVEAIYLICPNMHARELEIGRQALRAAQAAGVSRFVYHSVLHPQTEDMPHHWQKLRVEEMIFRSGLPFTILQPCAYMQNILAFRSAIAMAGTYFVPYDVRSRFALVDLYDVAQAAACALTESGHDSAIYELAGPDNLSSTEIAQHLSDHLQRPVEAVRMPLERWRRTAEESGSPAATIESLAAMFRYYDAYGLAGNGNVLEWLLGRRPTSLPQFLERSFPV